MPVESTALRALPVVAPLAAVALAVLLVRLHRRAALTAPRLLAMLAVCGYGAILVAETFFPFEIGRSPLPWTVWVQPIPLVEVPSDPSGILLNIALFVPVGVLLPLLLRTPTAGRVLLVGTASSLAIELLQLAGDLTVGHGRIADVDDLIGNVLGTLIGFGIVAVATRLPAVAAGARAAAWPHPAERAAERRGAPSRG